MARPEFAVNWIFPKPSFVASMEEMSAAAAAATEELAATVMIGNETYCRLEDVGYYALCHFSSKEVIYRVPLSESKKMGW